MKIQMPEFAINLPDLTEAINISNLLLNGEGEFFEKVRAIPSFAMSKHGTSKKPVTGEEVATLMAQKIDATVQTYKPFFARSKATAATVKGSDVIRLNMLKLDRPIVDLVATLVHESVHIADRVKGMSFGHNGNSSRGKALTAPYRIEAIARELALMMKTS